MKAWHECPLVSYAVKKSKDALGLVCQEGEGKSVKMLHCHQHAINSEYFAATKHMVRFVSSMALMLMGCTWSGWEPLKGSSCPKWVSGAGF